jgi:uncharacterized protein (DUF3084 family)
MSDTPRVDEFCKTSGGQYTYDLSGLARHLERKLAAAIAQRDKAMAQSAAMDEFLRSAIEQRDKAVEALRSELVTAIAQRDNAVRESDAMDEFLGSAIEQRDKAMEWVRGTLGTAHLKEMDEFIKEECGK